MAQRQKGRAAWQRNRQREPVDRAERQQVEPRDPALLAREPEAAGGQALGEDELARRRRELVDDRGMDELLPRVQPSHQVSR